MAHAHAHRHELGGGRRLAAAIALNVLLTIVQIVAGILAGSLALIADALHNLNDAAALVIAYGAERLAGRRADRRRTFGYRRAQVVGALINLTALILVGVYLVYQAVVRWLQPEPVDGWVVVIVASVALLIDAGTAALLYTAPETNLNLRAALVHNVTDALGSLAVILSGVLILLYDWTWVDPLVTVLIAAYVLYQGGTLIGRSVHILLESVPADIELDELVEVIESVEGVQDAHHLHAWELDERHRAMEAHVVIRRDDALRMDEIKAVIKNRLAERFDIRHATLEFEFDRPDETDVDPEHREVVPEH